MDMIIPPRELKIIVGEVVMRIPPLEFKIMLESNPLKSRISVKILVVWMETR